MFFAAGVGAYHIAMFHLFTHAFFKALLFLGAGSVIHSFNDEQDIDKMGGVWKKIPYTMVINVNWNLSFNRIFLSGFYSKDAIIEFVFLKDNVMLDIMQAVGIITAFLTAIYSWRLIFQNFFGKFNNN